MSENLSLEFIFCHLSLASKFLERLLTRLIHQSSLVDVAKVH